MYIFFIPELSFGDSCHILHYVVRADITKINEKRRQKNLHTGDNNRLWVVRIGAPIPRKSVKKKLGN